MSYKLMKMDFLLLPVDLRIRILLYFSLNDLWLLSSSSDPGIRITFHYQSRRYFTSRLRRWGISHLRKRDSDPFSDYILTLMEEFQAQCEPDLFDPQSPLLLPILKDLIGVDALAMRALRYSNHSLYQYLSQRYFLYLSKIRQSDLYEAGLRGDRLMNEHSPDYLRGLMDRDHTAELLEILTPISPIPHRITEVLVESGDLNLLRQILVSHPMDVVQAAIKYNQVEIVREYLPLVPLFILRPFFMAGLYVDPSREVMEVFMEQGYNFTIDPQEEYELPQVNLLVGAMLHHQMDFFVEQLIQPIPDSILKSHEYLLLDVPIYYWKLYFHIFPHPRQEEMLTKISQTRDSVYNMNLILLTLLREKHL